MNNSTIEYSETEDDIYANDSAYEEAQIDLIKHADENDCFNFVADLNDVEQDKELVTMSGGKLTIKTVYLNTMGFVWDLYEKRDEWEEIDNLVEVFQLKKKPGATEDEIAQADEASYELLQRFYPLFKKYIIVITTGQINFKNYEQKMFVRLFVNAPHLLHVLKKKNISRPLRDDITRSFNFIVESYGKLDTTEILADLQTLFLVLASRYKPTGKSFCCYVYNAYRFEVARHIKNFFKNPCNFHYKVTSLKDDERDQQIDAEYEEILENEHNETLAGTPNVSWIKGETCGDAFKNLTALERKIIVKYYVEDCMDSEIADMLGIHLNTANAKRKEIVAKIAKNIGLTLDDCVRKRKTGKALKDRKKSDF